MDPTTLDDLLAVGAIRNLKARYCRFVDTKQWQRLESLFAPDAQLEGFGSVPDGAGLQAFVSGISDRLAQAITVHHVHEPELVLIGPDAARGIWPMTDYVDFQNAQNSANRGWVGWGYYEEAYVRRDGNWLISFMRLTRQRMDDLTPDHPRANPGRHMPDPDFI